jgi:hypothetical protein
MAHAGTLCTPNGPHEPNKLSPFLDLCCSIFEVPELADYERHVCPSGCRYYFRGKLVNAKDHVANCPGCQHCKCSYCGAARSNVIEWGTLEPTSKCYFLFDTIEQWLLNQKRKKAFLAAHESIDTRCSAWHSSKEFHRMEAALKATTAADEKLPVSNIMGLAKVVRIYKYKRHPWTRRLVLLGSSCLASACANFCFGLTTCDLVSAVLTSADQRQTSADASPCRDRR